MQKSGIELLFTLLYNRFNILWTSKEVHEYDRFHQRALCAARDDLAEHQAEKYVPLKEVAARQEISEKYLENILKVLVQNGFLEGLRGKGGGYRLTRSPDQYTVEEILMLTEGSLAPVTCLTPGASPCDRLANCRTYEMWKGLNDLISNYFSHITLADLALPDQAGNDYVI